MKHIKFKWTGNRPLIMSNPQTVNIANVYGIKARKIQAQLKAARKKGDEDRLIELETEQRRNDFESSAYFDSKGFFLPDTIIMACLKEAARTLKKGKDIDRAVLPCETVIRIKSNRSFKNMDEAFADPAYRLETPCKVPPKTGALIWKCRCMIPSNWEIEFELSVVEDLIAAKTLIEVAHVAGELIGLGSWRPKFGRFASEVLP